MMQKYLIKNGGKSVAHLWDGEDTLCKQWSFAYSKAASSKMYKVCNDMAGKRVCLTCQNVKDTGKQIYVPPKELEEGISPIQSNAKINDEKRLKHVIGVLKSKVSWRGLKEKGDESVRKLIAIQEQSNPTLINPDKDNFYLGCEKLIDEIVLLASKR